MKTETRDCDVVIVGAGTAGSATAYQLARRGLRVVALEARALDSAGARWVNAIPPWMFDRADIPRPTPPELQHAHPPAVTLGPDGRGRVRVDPGPAWFIDIRALVARLHGLAREAGAELLEHVWLRELTLQDGRPTALTAVVEPTAVPPRRLRFRARLFVDATGLRGALRRLVPELDRHCPPVDGQHICLAAHDVCNIADPDGARDWLARIGGQPDEMISTLGVAGGWSTAAVTVCEDFGRVDLLTGCIGDGRHSSGARLMRELKAREPWIGSRRRGGAAPIPLRRPYDRLAAPGIALVGDAGCQVFSAHGSGTGAGMVAGKLLAEAVAGRPDPGSFEATWAYQAAFQRNLGAVHAAYDVFRRLAQRTAPEDIATLFASGLVTQDASAAGMDMRLPRLTLAEIARMARGVARTPRLATHFGVGMARMMPAAQLYRLYPRQPDLARLRRWSHRVAWLFDEAPDIP